MIRNTAMEGTFGQMAEFMKGTGLKGNSTVLVNTGYQSKT
jgi:hypothetical protein